MKKILSVLIALAIVLALPALSACSGKNGDQKATDAPDVKTGAVVTDAVKTPEPQPTNAPDHTAEAATDAAPTEAAPTEAPETEKPQQVKYQSPGSITMGDGTEHEVYQAKKTGAAVVVDGVMDDAYKAVDAIDISAVIDGSSGVDADAYFIWDAEYLYLFVDVHDDDANEYSSGDRWNSDSVELVLDTYNKADKLDQHYGEEYRGMYVGEGQFRVNCGGSELSGMHWMMDNPDVVKEAVSVVTNDGYTAEFKIGWASFGENGGAQAGKQVAFAICINDGNGSRSGVVSIESDMIHAWEWAGALARLDLAE